MKKPKKEQKIVVTFRLSPKTHARVELLGRNDKRNMANICELLIEQRIKQIDEAK